MSTHKKRMRSMSRPNFSRLLHTLPGPQPGPMTRSQRHRCEEANRRVEILHQYSLLLAAGKTRRDSAQRLGINYTTLWRWTKSANKRGYSGLLPSTDKCGRKPQFKRRPLPVTMKAKGGHKVTVEIVVKYGNQVVSTTTLPTAKP